MQIGWTPLRVCLCLCLGWGGVDVIQDRPPHHPGEKAQNPAQIPWLASPASTPPQVGSIVSQVGRSEKRERGLVSPRVGIPLCGLSHTSEPFPLPAPLSLQPVPTATHPVVQGSSPSCPSHPSPKNGPNYFYPSPPPNGCPSSQFHPAHSSQTDLRQTQI